MDIERYDRELCHCGLPVAEVPEINFNYGLCEHCRDVRCDAYPGACKDL